MGAGAGVGVGDGMGGICLSLHPRRYMYCTVPKGPLRASTFFWRGSFFFAFFSLDRVGELAAAAEEKVFGSFYICFFGGRGRGRFWYCCCCWALLGSSSFFLSFFPERASLEEGRGKMEERERKERKAV